MSQCKMLVSWPCTSKLIYTAHSAVVYTPVSVHVFVCCVCVCYSVCAYHMIAHLYSMPIVPVLPLTVHCVCCVIRTYVALKWHQFDSCNLPKQHCSTFCECVCTDVPVNIPCSGCVASSGFGTPLCPINTLHLTTVVLIAYACHCMRHVL